MDVGMVVRPMERGQITLPKKYREKLGITPQTPLNVALRRDEIVVKPLAKVVSKNEPEIIKPKLSRKEYLKVLETMKGFTWSEEDEALRKKSRKEDKERLRRFDW